MADTEESRIAKTEALLRAEHAEELDAQEADFVCECADPACTQRITASLERYEEVRGHGDTFLVAPGHEAAAHIERIVERDDGAHVVRKLDRLGELVRRLN